MSKPMQQWLADAAQYFEARPTGGEDMAHWANVYNAENCRKIATLLASQEAEIERLRVVSDALQDSAYLAGAKAGWHACLADDPNAAFAQLVESRAGYLKPLAALRPAETGDGQP